jgi:hypothetical protein
MSENTTKATKPDGFVKTGGKTLRPGRNTPGPHVTQNPEKLANQLRQTGDGKPPVATHHSGVKIQKPVTKKR